MTIKAVKTASMQHPAVPLSTYLLLDSIALRICAAWPTVPPYLRDDPANFSSFDLACCLAPTVGCTVDEAMSRVVFMLPAGIVRHDGTIDPIVAKKLDNAGARSMGLEDELDEGSDDDDTDNDDTDLDD